MGDLEARLAALELMHAEDKMHATLSAANANAWYLMWNGILVFFMQCGFGMLETGSVTARSTENILLKNLLDSTLAALVWWVAGHAMCSHPAHAPGAIRANGGEARGVVPLGEAAHFSPV